MVTIFRSFFLISLATGLMGLFLVVLVQVLSEPHPGFSRLPAPPTAFIASAVRN